MERGERREEEEGEEVAVSVVEEVVDRNEDVWMSDLFWTAVSEWKDAEMDWEAEAMDGRRAMSEEDAEAGMARSETLCCVHWEREETTGQEEVGVRLPTRRNCIILDQEEKKDGRKEGCAWMNEWKGWRCDGRKML